MLKINLVVNFIIKLTTMKTIFTFLLLTIFLLSISCSKEESENADQTGKSILSFELIDIKSVASIHSNENSIHLTVPARASITNIAPTISISEGASISPASLEAVDLSQPVIYTVTAADGSTREYMVTGEKLVDTALLIIDMQNAAFEITSFPIYNANEISLNIKTVADKARESNIHVVYSQATSASVQEGSPGWQVVPILTPHEEDIIVLKLASNAFNASDLHQELAKNGIGVVIMCGVATDMCINNSFIGANERRYDIIMLADGHSTSDPGAQEKIDNHNSIWASNGAAVLTSEEISF